MVLVREISASGQLCVINTRTWQKEVESDKDVRYARNSIVFLLSCGRASAYVRACSKGLRGVEDGDELKQSPKMQGN